MGRYWTRDTVAGLVCLGLAAFLFSLTFGLPKSPFVPIGPEFYPRLVLGATAIASVLLIATALATARRPHAAAVRARRNYGGVALAFALFFLYVAALPLLGFRVATFLFVAALAVLLEQPAGAPGWLRVGLTALLTAAATWLVFELYLSVLLPRGSWTGF